MLNDKSSKDGMEKDLEMYLKDNDNGEMSPSILRDAAKAVLRGKIIARTAWLKKMKFFEAAGRSERFRANVLS